MGIKTAALPLFDRLTCRCAVRAAGTGGLGVGGLVTAVMAAQSEAGVASLARLVKRQIQA